MTDDSIRIDSDGTLYETITMKELRNSTRPFKVGEPVRHSIFGTGEVKEVLNDMCRVKFDMGLKWIDAQYLTPALIITHTDPEPVEPVYKYGDQVEATDASIWYNCAVGKYLMTDPNGNHWVYWNNDDYGLKEVSCFKHIRPIPVDAREVLRLGLISYVDEKHESIVMERIDQYVATMKAKWEAERK